MPKKRSDNDAKILVLDKAGMPTKTIPCLFNPENYTISKKNTWQPAKAGGSGGKGKDKKTKQPTDTPQLTFGGGGSQILKVKLFFDGTADGTDVTKQTQEVMELMKVVGDGPPICQFGWGNFLSAVSVITDINQKFMYFSRQGLPLRAELDVTFQEQSHQVKKQNPTSVGPARRTWVVQSGDRLDLIAHQELGNATRWPEIAKVNHLLNPLELRAGQILQIPE